MKFPKSKFGYSTKDEYKSFEVAVKISTEFKFFYVVGDLPEELRALGICPHGPRSYHDSYHSLQSEIQAIIDEFECTLIEELKTKVILYMLDTESRDGQSIDFRWYTLQKVEMQKHSRKKSYTEVTYYTEEKRSGHYAGSALTEFNDHLRHEAKFEEMPWSKEREGWFREMDRAIQTLAERLKSGFGTRAELLARKIDQGMKSLLEASKIS